MIIVDLDDTILDTRRTLRRVKFDAIADLVGLDELRSFFIERLDDPRPGLAIIREACAAFDLDEDIEALARAEYYEAREEDPMVPLLGGARGGLERFAELDRLVCLSSGDEVQQRRKIRRAELEDVFDEIIIVGVLDDKGEVYARLLEASDEPADRFVVIGDKEGDVEPARTLGMHAIRFGAEWDGAYALDWFSLRTLVEALRSSEA